MSEQVLDLETMQRRLAGSMKLVTTTRELAGLHDLDEILNNVTVGTSEALNCERASLFVYEKSTQQLYTRVAIQLEIAEIRTSIDSGIVGWVARRRKVANIPEPKVDARWDSAVDRQTGFETRGILAAPVISQHDDRLLGVLQAINKREAAFDQFDAELLQAFASHAATALERAELLEKSRRSHALELAVEMARDIQTGFLPSTLCEISGYELAVWWQPADAVGGDYFDLIPLPDGRVGIVTADVSGHGFAASLLMASVRAMLHVLARTLSDPARILSLVAETVTPDLHSGRFITFLIAALDASQHELAFANAGHGPALHFRRDRQEFHELERTGLPIGFSDDFEIPLGPVHQIRTGDLVVLGTDGVVEVRNKQGEVFGNGRLRQLISEHRRLPAPQLLERIKAAVINFNPDEPPPDDVTLLILERKLG